jgi:hypothetical protein
VARERRKFPPLSRDNTPHTTGIHRIVVDRKKGKKGKKKRFNLLPPLSRERSHLFLIFFLIVE